MNSTQQVNEDQPITVQEEKELRRVFDHLCDFQTKVRLNKELLELKQHMTMARIRGNMNNSIVSGENSVNQQNENRLDEITREIVALDMNSCNKKITVSDVFEKLKDLNQKVNRKDVEEIIWEVDENLDSALDWNEFKLMFTRSISDKSGLEPSRMYNLTQFLIYDNNNSGLVSVDKTMNMLYARYGKDLDRKLKELFGADMHETGREGGEITFAKYLAAVEKVQMVKFWHTTKGKLINRNFKHHECADCRDDD